MRSLRTAISAGVTLALLVAPVAAAPSTKGDSVGGVAIRLGENPVQYTVSVKGGTAGTPIGSFLYRGINFRLTFGGTATCFDIDGNQAAIGGWITHAASADAGTAEAILGQAYLVFFEDNGSPSSPREVGPDIVSQAYILPADEGVVDVPAEFPAVCPDAATTAHDAFDVQGDFTVTDQ